MVKRNDSTENEQELKQLAQQIQASHKNCLKSFRSGLDHARTAGTLLIQAKKLVKRGRWQAWVDESCAFDLRMAQNYMVIAEHFDAVVETLAKDGLATMTSALAAIRDLKGTDGERSDGKRTNGERNDSQPQAHQEFQLPPGGFEQKRDELGHLLAEARSVVENDAKLAMFLDDQLEAVYASVRRFVDAGLSYLKVDGLDAGHLAIVLIDHLKDRLDAAKLFTPPPPTALEQGIAETSETSVVPVDAPVTAAPVTAPALPPPNDSHQKNGKRELVSAGI